MKTSVKLLLAFATAAAAIAPAAAHVVLLSTGTIDVESFERPFALPKEEEAFIRTAVESNPNPSVLVNSGSGIRMGGWNDKAAAVIYGWYPGQSGFTALADILSGKLSPSGKLPMTIEKEFNDSPAKGTMPAGAEFYNKAPRAYNERLIQLYDIDYKESVLVGYRWYETKGIAPLYPFGFGLSYTTFELSKPRAPKAFPADKPLKVSVTLTNTGDREGAEVVQLYVTENAPTAERLPESDPGPRQKRRRGVRTRPAGAGVLGHAVARLEGQPGRIHPFAGNLVGRHRRHAARLGEITPQRQERTASAESSLLTIVNEVSVSRPSPRLLFLPFIAHHAELQHAVSRLLAHSRTESDRSIRQYAAFGRIHLRFRHKSPKNLPAPYEPLILYMDSVCRNA